MDDAVLFWNSVYLCAGLSASALSQGMNANQWLVSSIGPLLGEILSKATVKSSLGGLSTGQQVITTRLFWLISCWMYHFDSELIPQILHLIHLALDESRYIDEVCILTALETLQSILKCPNFHPVEHVSFLLPILSSVWTVMSQKLLENESRSTAVQTIGMMIDFVNSEHLVPVLGSLQVQLHEIWLDCEDSSPLRISLLDVSVLFYVRKLLYVNYYNNNNNNIYVGGDKVNTLLRRILCRDTYSCCVLPLSRRLRVQLVDGELEGVIEHPRQQHLEQLRALLDAEDHVQANPRAGPVHGGRGRRGQACRAQ
jgi:hypothetical protein